MRISDGSSDVCSSDLKEGVEPEYAKCVDISTGAALKEMLIPGGLAIGVPLVIGFIDVDALGGFLAGALVVGFCLAIFMANSGGAWDNEIGRSSGRERVWEYV